MVIDLSVTESTLRICPDPACECRWHGLDPICFGCGKEVPPADRIFVGAAITTTQHLVKRKNSNPKEL